MRRQPASDKTGCKADHRRDYPRKQDAAMLLSHTLSPGEPDGEIGTPRPYPCPAMGNPASFQAATPPLRALALAYPSLIKAAA